MERSQIEFIVSAYEHKVRTLHSIADHLETLELPQEEILRILNNIQDAIQRHKKN